MPTGRHRNAPSAHRLRALQASRSCDCITAVSPHSSIVVNGGVIDRTDVVSYSRHMVEILTTGLFDRWLRRLKDRQARLRILERIDRLTHGNPGDAKAVGQGVRELRLTHGPGYRIYYLQEGDTLILLLCGGDKSTQRADINKAHQLANEWNSRKDDDDNRE